MTNNNKSKRSIKGLKPSLIDSLRELGFTTVAEALERQERDRIAEFIRFKERQDKVIDNTEEIN